MADDIDVEFVRRIALDEAIDWAELEEIEPVEFSENER